jgi:hypothetical protein
VNFLLQGALTVLSEVYSADRVLFPYSTRVIDGAYRSTYDSPRAIRCSINCLLGLAQAGRRGVRHPLIDGVEGLTEQFLAAHRGDIADPGDRGLLTVLLSDPRFGEQALDEALGDIERIAGDERLVRSLNVEQLTWLVWGAVAAHEAGRERAEPLAHRLWDIVVSEFLDGGASLPRHTRSVARRRMVSFGAAVYYLHVADRYGRRFGRPDVLSAFERGASDLLAAQGPWGEWPWMLSTRNARPLDIYPVFSVHQTSMAMLFLFPALDAGLPGVERAMSQSLSCLTTNQLAVPMWQDDPFFLYRSIERRTRGSRGERYLRAMYRSLSARPAPEEVDDRLRMNVECRAYELGWVLYRLAEDVVQPAVAAAFPPPAAGPDPH